MFLIVQHEPGEGTGLLAPFARPFTLVRTFAGDAVPAAPGSAHAVVVLGGGMGVYEQDRLPHLAGEIALLRRCIDADVPVLGLCLGSQLLAAALGAPVSPSGRKEIGFHPVRLTPASRTDPLFAGVAESFTPFHWHGGTFPLPEGAVCLASSALTSVQAFRFRDRFWGIQFHPEVDAEVLGAMVAGGEPELLQEGITPAHLLARSRDALPRMAAVSTALFTRFTSLASGLRPNPR